MTANQASTVSPQPQMHPSIRPGVRQSVHLAAEGKRTCGQAEEALRGSTRGGVAKDGPAAGAELRLWSGTTDA